MKLKDADAPHLLKIEDAIGRALRPFNNPGTESALAALACIRIAKQLLDPYPAIDRQQMLPAMIAYLSGGQVQPAEGASALWTPPNHFGPIGKN
jgi:hypothetical protein